LVDLNWHGDTVRDCAVLLDYIEWLCRFGLYDTLDTALYNIRIDGNSMMFVGFIRYTWQLHKNTKRLPSWRYARDKAYKELIRRDEDADNILRGLMDL